MVVYGVDLGTTYSSLGYLDVTGRPAVIQTADGTDAIPSVVYFASANEVVVGEEAKDTAVLQPDLVVDLIKRELGSSHTVAMHGDVFTPEEVSALILRRLINDAQAYTRNSGSFDESDDGATPAVIAVPASFGTQQREATRISGEAAGLSVIDVISEPIAAAISYGVLDLDPGAEREQTILIYDLGGGTFDITVIAVRGQQVEEICTGGDPELGGVDWDDRLAEQLVEEFFSQHPDSSHPFDDPGTLHDIRHQVEDAKIRLSSEESQTVRIVHEGRVATVELTRAEFESRTKDLLDRTIEITRNALAVAAQRGVPQVDEIILVGGSSRMPAVTARLVAEFGLQPRLHEPELAVAKGAARYGFDQIYHRMIAAGRVEDAQRLAARTGLSADQEQRLANQTLRPVVPRSIGIMCSDGEYDSVVHLLHGNDPLPAGATATLFTGDAGQSSLTVQIVEQSGPTESPDPSANRMVALGSVKLAEDQPAGTPVELTLTMSSGGLLHAYFNPEQPSRPHNFVMRVGNISDADIPAVRERLSQIKVR
ncbi:Hsp70 family protein [Fodinicola acaciae]|uniref:Hsp70 family protein n=1 Tax=Fodinicola acaciae TaxID=2681555 RepID=UPI0013D070A3|nr:Hsp70 family protein [Fodinicola acaciae]